MDEDIEVNLVKRNSSEPKQGWKMLKQVNWSTAGWRWKTRDHADYQLSCFFSVRPKWYKRPDFPFHPAALFAYPERKTCSLFQIECTQAAFGLETFQFLEFARFFPTSKCMFDSYLLIAIFSKKTSPFPKNFKKPKSTGKSFQKNWVISMRLGRPVRRVWRRGGNTIKLMISPPPLFPTNLLSLQCLFVIKFIPAAQH